jgi:hypothetical protein
MMFAFFMQQACLVILLLGQLAQAALPTPGYDNDQWVIAATDGIGGIYRKAGDSLDNDDIAQLAKAATIQARQIARDAGKTEVLSFAVYINAESDLVLGASGASTGKHAEFVVQAICNREKIPFEGGKIVTWNFTNKKFIEACVKCRPLLANNGSIEDMYRDFGIYRDRRRSTIDGVASDSGL